MYVCMYVCMYACMHISCTYVHMYVCMQRAGVPTDLIIKKFHRLDRAAQMVLDKCCEWTKTPKLISGHEATGHGASSTGHGASCK